MTPRNTARGALRTAGLAAIGAAVLLVSACGTKAAQQTTSAAESLTSAAGSMASVATSAAASAGSQVSSAAQSAISSVTSAAGSQVSQISSAVTSKAGEMLDQAAVDAATKTLIAPGKLTVCTTLPFEPFESADASGNVVGFDIDVVQWVADALKAELDIKDMKFEGIKSGEAMNSGQCDVAAAGMSITPERQKAFTFSDAYFDANFALVVASDSTIATLEDLKGKVVAGQTSTTGLDWLKANESKYGYTVKEFEGFDIQSQAILTKQVDAAFNDVPVFNKLLKDNADKIKKATEVETGDQYGLGMKKDNNDLKKVVDATLTAAKGDGRYDAAYTKWIGEKPTS